MSRSLPDSNSHCLAILTGARQTGKTTLARSTYPLLHDLNLVAQENREFVRQCRTFSFIACWDKAAQLA